MGSVKVYGPAVSTAVSRVLACLLEKEVPFHLVPVSLAKAHHKSPDFLKLQPFGQVPAFQDGDLTLFESRAICWYICDKFSGQGNRSLMGAEGGSAADRAAVDQCVEAESQNFNPPSTTLVSQLVFAPKMRLKQDPNATRDAEARLRKVLDVYETRMRRGTPRHGSERCWTCTSAASAGAGFRRGRNSRSRICATSRMPTTSSPRPTRGSSCCRRGGTSRGGGRRSPAAPRGQRSSRCGAMQLLEILSSLFFVSVSFE